MSVTGQDVTAAVAPALAQIEQILTALGDVDVPGLPGQELLDTVGVLEGISRKVEALSSRVLAAVDAHGLWALDGARSLPAWYRARTGRSTGSARASVNRARRLSSTLPASGQALTTGTVSTDHIALMVRHAATTPKLREQLASDSMGEEWLVEQAQQLDATAFAKVLRAWSTRVDPDAADRGYTEETGREEFYLSETTDGYVPGGWLSKESGQALTEALTARMGVPSTDDPRTPAQRRAHALTAIARLALDSGTLRPGARVRPHLAVHVPYDTLLRLLSATTPPHQPGCPRTGADDPQTRRDHAGAAFGLAAPVTAGTDGTVVLNLTSDASTASTPACTCPHNTNDIITAALDTTALAGAEPATLADGTVLAPTQLARLACDSTIHRVIFGPDGEVLDVGREHRLYTPAQRRAIIARDRQCVFPDCDAPPGEGEIHHAVQWAHGGRTTIRTGTLACWHHHDYIHRHHIRIERRHGRWHLHRRDGTEIHPRRQSPG